MPTVGRLKGTIICYAGGTEIDATSILKGDNSAMNTVSTKPVVVDMDSHVLEPPDLWEEYIEPRYRDRSIHVRKNENGIEELIVDNTSLLQGRLALLGGVNHQADELFMKPEIPYLEGCPKASYDTDARVALLDEWGVDAGVVFPTIGILWD